MVLSTIAMALALAAAAPEATAKPTLVCDVGPVRKTYGGTGWLLYSCSDKATLVVVSDAGNPASPFYFIFRPQNGVYQLDGEGTGSKDATAAAFEDLKGLRPDQVTVLINETRSLNPSP